MIFKNLPYNTNRTYVIVEDKSGCLIYVPIAKIEDAEIVKEMMYEFLNSQPQKEISNDRA